MYPNYQKYRWLPLPQQKWQDAPTGPPGLGPRQQVILLQEADDKPHTYDGQYEEDSIDSGGGEDQ